jgi:hypothetical protein
MKTNLTESEIQSLRYFVRNTIFNRIKFVPSPQLGIESGIFQKMFEHIKVNDDNLKQTKFVGVKYLLQRQMNSKRNYCTEKICKEIKGT